MSYKLTFRTSFEKDIAKLPQSIVVRVVKRVKLLAEVPLPKGVRKLQGKEAIYRLRIGDYRVIYSVDAQTKTVDLIYVRHRKDVYRKL